MSGEIIINNGAQEYQDKNVTITVKRGAKGGYAWEIKISGDHEKDVSQRVTALNATYIMLYGRQGASEAAKEAK